MSNEEPDKKINGGIKAFTSRASSGVSTPIEKTDSVINLTKPSLYSIYNENSVTALNGDDESDANDNSLYVTTTRVEETVEEPIFQGPISVLFLKSMLKIGVLTGCAYLYNEITRHIRNNHIKVNLHTFQPLYITEHFITKSLREIKPLSFIGQEDPLINYVIVLTIQGTIMGVMHPILDFLVPPEFNGRVLTSNPDPKKRNEPATLFNDTLRLLITFLGISYAIRNLEWSSSLQVSVVWSLLSPCLWLILDGTIPGLISGIVVTTYGCLFVLFMNFEFIQSFSNSSPDPEVVPIWLWTSSFFFCGMIIFGKIGRALF